MADGQFKATPPMRVVRLAPWLLEVIQEQPDRPWDQWVSSHGKRRDAERVAAAGSGAPLDAPPAA